MNDVTNKMIFDGYKSLSDKIDRIESLSKRMCSYINEHRRAIIELNDKVEVMINDNALYDGFCKNDEDYMNEACLYSDMDTLIVLTRSVMENENLSLHDVIKRLINNV